MSSTQVFNLMEVGDWNNVRDLIMTTSWSSQNLEEKHGVGTELTSHVAYIRQF